MMSTGDDAIPIQYLLICKMQKIILINKWKNTNDCWNDYWCLDNGFLIAGCLWGFYSDKNDYSPVFIYPFEFGIHFSMVMRYWLIIDMEKENVICLECAYSVFGFLIRILMRKSILVIFSLVHLKIKYITKLFLLIRFNNFQYACNYLIRGLLVFGCQITLGYNIMERKLSQRI